VSPESAQLLFMPMLEHLTELQSGIPASGTRRSKLVESGTDLPGDLPPMRRGVFGRRNAESHLTVFECPPQIGLVLVLNGSLNAA